MPASTTTTVVAQPATEPLPVGPAIVPTDAAAGDSTATLAADALRFHRATEQAINELAWIGLARQLAADKVRDLTARVTQLNTTAIDLARRGAPTAETAVLRAHAVADLDAARLDEAGLALRLASAENIVDAARTDYERARGALSAAVAASGSVDGTTLDAKWATTTPERLDVVFAALTRVGAPYVFGAVGPDTFDCSGLTAFAWQAAGVSLAHYTVTQRTSTLAVPSDALQAGDLVFNLNGPDGGHVMMYLGAGQAVVEARSPGTKVQVSTWHVVTGFGSPLADVPAEPADGRNALPSATSIVTGSLGDAASAVVDTTATRR